MYPRCHPSAKFFLDELNAIFKMGASRLGLHVLPNAGGRRNFRAWSVGGSATCGGVDRDGALYRRSTAILGGHNADGFRAASDGHRCRTIAVCRRAGGVRRYFGGRATLILDWPGWPVTTARAGLGNRRGA